MKYGRVNRRRSPIQSDTRRPTILSPTMMVISSAVNETRGSSGSHVVTNAWRALANRWGSPSNRSLRSVTGPSTRGPVYVVSASWRVPMRVVRLYVSTVPRTA